MSGKLQLLIIDPQNDFCDIHGAALPVAGACDDLGRVAALIERLGPRLDSIHVTLDTHNPIDIAHPGWWQDRQGDAPAPFTVIGVDDVASGAWRTRDPARQAQSEAYVRTLAARGRYQLVVWPEHCLIGGWGHNVEAGLFDVLGDWARQRLRLVNYVQKGMNEATEHYSAIQAEVPDADDPRTRPDLRWIARLAEADTLLVAGQALSHCVAATVRDLVTYIPPERIVLLTDCSSPVPGFETLGELFVAELSARGMRLATAEDWR
ncbi:hypothetical protein GCM10007860_03340 [Chitiniphilus shinanonensis]|uniref:Uncharacterized protein n=1 Tax=Chitiniphilus shinanonensis TaxID=553088 RepID=F8WSY2_9NEIS|nr:isochorismatase family protein [Chitiniphilus shinanonensis]BAK53969.1 hypothetical protein [Chitiniphilus shinanonensis]GLS03191.1 hypothetical protein GCM10007860_03340 [Chitiniphilus shinanonensis]